MNATTRERMKCKFDICYVMAKEGIVFSKYPALYDLESQHDVDLGVAYKNDVSALVTLLIVNMIVLFIFFPTCTTSAFSWIEQWIQGK